MAALVIGIPVKLNSKQFDQIFEKQLHARFDAYFENNHFLY